MRIRALIAASGIALTSVVVFPAAAGASPKAGELYECIEKAITSVAGENATAESINSLSQSQKDELDTKAKDCYSAPNPIIPEISEVIWGGLAFLIVAIALMKFGWPQLKKGLQARQDTIRNELESAEKAKNDADAAKAEYESKIAEAKTESSRLIEEARQTAEGVRADTLKRAEEEAAAIRARANEDAQAAAARAMTDLQGQVGAISIELAEKIVEKNLDASAQQSLIENFISQVGRN
ncbi:MAG: F0F1 ATP synthase subunit B [Acidimicrobiia bacterium]